MTLLRAYAALCSVILFAGAAVTIKDLKKSLDIATDASVAAATAVIATVGAMLAIFGGFSR